jgi:hypothetical protein
MQASIERADATQGSNQVSFTGMNRIHLFEMDNRTFGPFLAMIDKILSSVIYGGGQCTGS